MNPKLRARNRRFVQAVKEAAGCAGCKLDHPHWRLQFDHLPDHTKRRDLAYLAGQGYSLKTIITEIMKCEVVCANCHADRTWSRLVAVAGLEPTTSEL